MITYEPMQPIKVLQEIPSGKFRILGESETLIRVRRGFGDIPGLIDARTPYLEFMASNGKISNISFFRNRFMRDTAYFEIINPKNNLNTQVTLDMKRYFSKFKKPGNLKVQDAFIEELKEAWNPQVRKHFIKEYAYITEKVDCPLPKIFADKDASVALYLYLRNELQLKPITRSYTLDLLILKIAKHGRPKIA